MPWGKRSNIRPGDDVKIGTPLDFQGVTDHSEYVGVVRLANDPTSSISKLPVAAKLKVTKDNNAMQIFQWLAGSIAIHKPIAELLDPQLADSVWKHNAAIADKYNKPGQLTAFCSYEGTSMPNNENMHRNVFFKDCAKVSQAPFSAIESDQPEDLWTWMDGQRKATRQLARGGFTHEPIGGRHCPATKSSFVMKSRLAVLA